MTSHLDLKASFAVYFLQFICNIMLILAGRYVMRVSLFNRLGGHVMHWSQLPEQRWGGETLPIIHEGRFYNSEMKVLFTS